MLSWKDVQQARERIRPFAVRTPLLRAPALDAWLGCQVYLKPEMLQRTGSFKVRGASSRMTLLTEEERGRGVVTASSGNHAKAVAYVAQCLGIDATVIMPENPNPAKLEGIRKLGAKVLFCGTQTGERTAKARQLAKEEGYVLVHSHADFYVLAGQGTIALEVLEDEPELTAIVTPVGGGGLISGTATAAKAIQPSIRVFGAEPAQAPRYAKSLEAGKALTIQTGYTIADGTRCTHADAGNFELIRQRVDGLFQAEETSIQSAVALCVAEAKLVAEPSSVLGIAAAMEGKLPVRPEDKVCFVLTGGNNDLAVLERALRCGTGFQEG